MINIALVDGKIIEGQRHQYRWKARIKLRPGVPTRPFVGSGGIPESREEPVPGTWEVGKFRQPWKHDRFVQIGEEAATFSGSRDAAYRVWERAKVKFSREFIMGIEIISFELVQSESNS